MKNIKRVLLKIRDIYEIFIPATAFCMMFLVFIWGIFCRYVLKTSATWANEIQILGYLWTVLPAALWARRRNDHVCFALLYDSVNPAWQRIIRILGNLFMAIMYTFLFLGSVKYIMNLRQRSMALEISLKYLYMPFPILIGGIWVYSVWDLYTDTRDIVLEAMGKKEHISMEKVDKAAEYLAASEAEFQALFNADGEDKDCPRKEEEK